MASLTDDNAADGNLDKRNIKLINVDYTRYTVPEFVRDEVVTDEDIAGDVTEVIHCRNEGSANTAE